MTEIISSNEEEITFDGPFLSSRDLFSRELAFVQFGQEPSQKAALSREKSPYLRALFCKRELSNESSLLLSRERSSHVRALFYFLEREQVLSALFLERALI